MKYRNRCRRLAAALLSALITFPSTAIHAQMATPGAFRVSESGAAAYEIAVRAPPGTAGMAPKLSLTYNSQGGNGLMGVGWSLSGLSAITRCPRTIAQDGVRGGVLFDWNDRYCLDGQRMIALTPGTDGWAGSEYRTERDTFAKIVAVNSAGNGPQWFQVQTKSGQTIEYGNTADSRIEAKGRTEVRVWAVNKITDTMGNSLTVTYNDDQVNGDYYPTRIDYTANPFTTPVLVAGQSVQFVYETRPDIAALYQAGSQIKNTVRLKNVQTYVGTSLVTDYRIAYATSPNTSRSRVTTITECPLTGSCMPAITVSWSVPTTSFGADASWGVRTDTVTNNGGGTKLYDVNGDGLSDLVYDGATGVRVMLNTGTAFGTDTSWGVRSEDINATSFGIRFSDMNRDGKMDMVYDSATGIRVMLSSGTAFGADAVWGTRLGNYVVNDGGRLMLIDVNGDDRPDAVYDSTTGIRGLLSTGSAFGTDTVRGTRVANMNPTGGALMLADMNGDGFPDAVYDSDGSGVRVLLNDGAGGFGTDTQWGTRAENFGANSPGIRLADVNGDGLPDIVYDGVSTGVRVMLNTGTGLATDSLWGTRVQSFSAGSPGLRLVDVNADGRADIIYDSADGVRALLSTGAAFGADTIWGTRTDDLRTGGVQAEDVGGDGRGDVFYDGMTGERVLKTSGIIADLAATISNGIGVTTTPTYKPLTDTSVYTKDTSATYPTRDLRVPLHVVSSYTTSNGIGGTYQMTYFYWGAKANLQGRGLLGFRIVQATDPAGLKSVTTYEQSWPFTGLPLQVQRKRADDGVITQVDNIYACIPVACTSPVFVYVSQSDEAKYDLNGVFMTKVRTTNAFNDGFGNPTQIVVTHLNSDNSATGYSKTTTNTYTNDTVGWILGRLTQSTVAAVTP